jgi:hypothetical protein
MDTTKLDIFIAVVHQAVSTLPAAFHHATVVPTTNTNSADATHHIGDNIEWIKVPPVWKEALRNF